MDKRELAEWLHDTYEEIAVDVGWETQDGTSVPFDELPDDNQEVMLRLAERLLDGHHIAPDVTADDYSSVPQITKERRRDAIQQMDTTGLRNFVRDLAGSAQWVRKELVYLSTEVDRDAARRRDRIAERCRNMALELDAIEFTTSSQGDSN